VINKWLFKEFPNAFLHLFLLLLLLFLGLVLPIMLMRVVRRENMKPEKKKIV
jgi:cell division protein FtsI/penicillin-binding protein 2